MGCFVENSFLVYKIVIVHNLKMSFGSAKPNWNRFLGTYFKEGIDVQGNITIEPTYKLITDAIEVGTITATGAITNGSNLLMKADGTRSILFTTDGNGLNGTNCIGRIFGTTAQMYLDFYTNFLFRSTNLSNSVSTDVFKINPTNSVFYYPLTTNTLTNNSTLTQIGTSTFSGKITNNSTLAQIGTSSFSGEITNTSTLNQIGQASFAGGIENNGSLNQYTGATFSGGITNNSYGITNNSTLTQVGSTTIKGSITFKGDGNSALPTSTTTLAGLSIYWNKSNGNGETCFLNMGQLGPGGFAFYTGSSTSNVKCVAYIDNSGNLSNVNNITCSGNLVVNGNSISSTILSYLSTLTSNVQTQLDNLANQIFTSLKVLGSLTCKNINVSEQLTANSAIISDLTVTNLTYNSFTAATTTTDFYCTNFNDSRYVRIAGSVKNVSGTCTYSWKSSLSSGVISSDYYFQLAVPTECISIFCQYSFFKLGGPTGRSNGITPYYWSKCQPAIPSVDHASTDRTWAKNIGTTIGSYYHQPTLFDCSYYDLPSSSQFYSNFNLPTEDGAEVYFSYNIWFY